MSTRPKILFLKAPAAAAAAGVEVDDAMTGFEDLNLTGYFSATGEGGTISVSQTYKKYGLNSVRILTTTAAMYAYLRRGPFSVNTTFRRGVHRLQAYVYIVTYYGTTANDGQDVYSRNDANAKNVLYFALRATGVYFFYNGTALPGQIASALSTGTWHKLLAEFDYDTTLVKCWIDDVLIGSWTPTGTLYAPDYFYFGDVSATILRGDFYWDTCMIGRKA